MALLLESRNGVRVPIETAKRREAQEAGSCSPCADACKEIEDPPLPVTWREGPVQEGAAEHVDEGDASLFTGVPLQTVNKERGLPGPVRNFLRHLRAVSWKVPHKGEPLPAKPALLAVPDALIAPADAPDPEEQNTITARRPAQGIHQTKSS